VDLVTGNRDKRRRDRATDRGESYRNGKHDNGRTDFRDPD
jgi:hypothetical protein